MRIGRPWLALALACLLGAAALMPATTPANADSLTGGAAQAQPTASAGEPSLLRIAMARFVRLQRDVNRALSDGVVAIKDGRSSAAVLLAMLVAFAYGVLHAIGPGHGKAVILGYFLSRDGSIWRGLRMGAQIAVLHVVSAVVIVVVVRWLLDIAVAGPVDQLQALKLLSYGAITAVGLLMLARSLRSRRRPATVASSGHAHDCGHHHHGGGEGGLLSLAAGLVPCSGAVLVLIYALANGLLLSGLAMTASIAAGMAVTLSAIGMSAAWTRGRMVGGERPPSPARRSLRAALDLLGPLVIALLGAALLAATVLA